MKTLPNPTILKRDKCVVRALWISFAVILILAGAACLLLNGPLLSHAVDLTETYLSSDHNMTAQDIGLFRLVLVGYALMALGMGLAFALNASVLTKTVPGFLSWYRRFPGERFVRFIFWGSLAVGVILVALRSMVNPSELSGRLELLLHAEDGFLEMLSAILFVVSGVLCLIAAVLLRRHLSTSARIATLPLVGIALALIFFGLEEISWGYRLFDLALPPLMEAINDSGEINIHNISSRLLDPAYRLGTAAFICVIISGWLVLLHRRESMLKVVIPHPATIGLLTLILFFGSIWTQHELLEQLGAFFSLFYGLTVLKIARTHSLVGS